MIKSRCNKCGAKEITAAAIGSKCMFCGEGIMRITMTKDSGYICVDCQEPINEENLAFAEENQPFHKECLKGD